MIQKIFFFFVKYFIVKRQPFLNGVYNMIRINRSLDNILMTSQQDFRPIHTKVLQVFRSKQSKNKTKDLRQQLFFKIKPEKSVSELVIPYKDLKSNFPYALIEYYEANIKIRNDSQINFQSLTKQTDKNINLQKKDLFESKKQNIQQVLNKNKDNNRDEEKNISCDTKKKLILDFDKFLQENDQPMIKPFYALFDQFQDHQNRYLKDLNNDDHNLYGRRYDSNLSKYETKRKKNKFDFVQ